MNNPGLKKTFIAAAAIAAFRAVKFGATDTEAAQASAATDAFVGVSGMVVPTAVGERVDVVMTDITEIEYGAVVTRGDLLTVDALGRAILSVTTNNVIGMAMVSGVLGDIGSLLIARSKRP